MLKIFVLMSPKNKNTNFLTWAALRSSIINMNSKSPCNLLKLSDFDPMNFEFDAKVFDAYVCKSKQLYLTIIHRSGGE